MLLPMVAFAAKRLVHKSQLILATVLGLIITVTLVTAVPVFSDGMSEFLLQRELKEPNVDRRQPSSSVMLRHFSRPEVNEPPTTVEEFLTADSFFAHRIGQLTGMEEISQVTYLQTDVHPVLPFTTSLQSGRRERTLEYAWFATASDVDEHIRFLEGRAPTSEVGSVDVDGDPAMLVEVSASSPLLDKFGYLVGDRIKLIYTDQDTEEEHPIVFDIVGRWVATDPENRSYWFYSPIATFDRGGFMVNRDVYLDHLVATYPGIFYEATWYSDFDPASIRASSYRAVAGGLVTLRAATNQILPGTKLDYSPQDVIVSFNDKLFFLKLLLFILAAPVVAIILYYVSLTAGMVIDQQRSEIAVLKSRGVGTLQIVGVYIIEGLLVAAIALGLGPLLALGLAQIIGKTYTFLVFTDRENLPVMLTQQHYLYAAGAVFLAVLATLIPAIGAARLSVVEFKQDVSRTLGKPFYQRFFLDVLIVGVVIYGYMTLRDRDSLLSFGPGGELFSDPLLVVMPVLFIFAVALLFLRFIPYLVALLAAIGGRYWGVGIHLGLRQIGRSPGQYTRLVLLLVLTFALGTFSASMAATIDRNISDRAYFEVGSEVLFEETGFWDADNGVWIIQPADLHSRAVDENGDPMLEQFARLWKDDDAHFVPPGRTQAETINVYGVDPIPFAKTVWWRSDFAPYHINSMMNALAADERALLADRSYFADQLLLRQGDPLTIRFAQLDIEFFIAGWIDDFPTHYPESGPFVVANLDYIHRNIGESPWNVLGIPAEGVSVPEIAEKLWELRIDLLRYNVTAVTIQDSRADATQTGTFGILTVGFVISTLLTLLGFLLYSFLSFRRRLQEFGVLRAMGLSVRQMINLFMFENGFLIGMGTLVGTALGILTGNLFIPFLQLSADRFADTPAFIIETAWADIGKIYLVLGVVLLVAVPVSIWMLRRIRIHEAMKFGDETG